MYNLHKMEELRKAKGWSRAELARRLGLGATALQDWIKKNTIPESRIHAVADLLDTTIDYLADRTDNPQKDQKYALSPQQVEMMMRALQSRGLLNPDVH